MIAVDGADVLVMMIGGRVEIMEAMRRRNRKRRRCWSTRTRLECDRRAIGRVDAGSFRVIHVFIVIIKLGSRRKRVVIPCVVVAVVVVVVVLVCGVIALVSPIKAETWI